MIKYLEWEDYPRLSELVLNVNKRMTMETGWNEVPTSQGLPATSSSSKR